MIIYRALFYRDIKMKNKKLYIEAIIVAILALIALPIQQLLLKYVAKPVKKVEFNSQALKENWSECALSGNSAGVINMVRVNIYEKNIETAEAWMKFGTYELQSPSVILFYGT